MNKWIILFNKLFVCPTCVYRCKGKVILSRGYSATKLKNKNKLVCGGVIR